MYEILLDGDYFDSLGISEINKLIEDTGYQYYHIFGEDIVIVMLTENEVNKLERERGWRLILPQGS